MHSSDMSVSHNHVTIGLRDIDSTMPDLFESARMNGWHPPRFGEDFGKPALSIDTRADVKDHENCRFQILRQVGNKLLQGFHAAS